MKRKCLFLISAVMVLLFGCSKEYEVSKPNLEIAVNKQTYKLGDTVNFIFSGQADFISFYSGEGKSEYFFHDKERTYQDIRNLLSFKSAKYSGNNSNCAVLKYSTDFDGKYNRESIRNAQWTEISSRFFIPGIVGSVATFSESGQSNVNDLFLQDGKPIYFAWFFETRANSNRTLFQVEKFNLIGVATEDPSMSLAIYNHSDFNFKMVLGEGFDGVTGSFLPSVNTTRVLWAGELRNTSYKEGWAVSGPIYKREGMNLGTDKAEVIKVFSEPTPLSYRYIYKEPGEYTVTFVVANSSAFGRQEVVKQIKITIEP